MIYPTGVGDDDIKATPFSPHGLEELALRRLVQYLALHEDCSFPRFIKRGRIGLLSFLTTTTECDEIASFVQELCCPLPDAILQDRFHFLVLAAILAEHIPSHR